MGLPPQVVVILVVTLASLLFPLFCLSLPIQASAAQSHQEQYRHIQKELKSHEKKLESVKKAERSALDDLTRSTADLAEINVRLKRERAKIASLRQTISVLEQEISLTKKKVDEKKKILRTRLNILHRFSGERDAMLLVLSGEDPAVVLRTVRYMKDISRYDFALITKYQALLDALSAKQADLAGRIEELRTEETNLAGTEKALGEKKREHQKLLESVRKEKRAYEKMIADLRESSNKLYRIIQESERRERELKKKRGSQPPRTAQAPQDDSGFGRLKGQVPWPVNGTVAIHYGSQVDPMFNLPVFRSGIHIKSPLGTAVKAVHPGKVVFADSFKGYNLLVIVNHGGGYHTLYGNLSKIFLKDGAIIRENQTVGEVGESSSVGGGGLYFEVRYNGKPLDPLQWLRK